VIDNGQAWWVGFPAQDGEFLVKFILDQTQFARQAHANLSYYRACIDGFNGG